MAKDIYRDPVRSSHSHLVKANGLRWLCRMPLKIGWAGCVRGLAFHAAPRPLGARRLSGGRGPGASDE